VSVAQKCVLIFFSRKKKERKKKERKKEQKTRAPLLGGLIS
jgi:hypothetical protein